MGKINYTNKTTLNPQPSIADENKVTSGDMNEIKSVVNGNFTNNSVTVGDTTPTGDNITATWIKASGNIFDSSNANILNALLRTSDNTLYASSSERSLYVECQPNTTYRITKNAGARFRVDERASTPTTGSANINMVMNDKVSSITYTTSANGNYLVVNYFTTSETGTEQDMLNSISIEVVPSINVLENNIYKEIYRKPIILWTNPNPTSSFAAQNITLSTSDYDMYEVIFKQNVTQTNSQSLTLRALKNYNVYASFVININAGQNQNTGFRVRTVNYTNETTLAVQDGLQKNETTGVPATNNDILVPMYVIGYKTGLFS